MTTSVPILHNISISCPGRGILGVEWSSEAQCGASSSQPAPVSCQRPEIQTFSWEYSRNQVFSVSTKHSLLASSCLTVALRTASVSAALHSLFASRASCGSSGFRLVFTWHWSVVRFPADMTGFKGFSIRINSQCKVFKSIGTKKISIF